MEQQVQQIQGLSADSLVDLYVYAELSFEPPRSDIGVYVFTKGMPALEAVTRRLVHVGHGSEADLLSPLAMNLYCTIQQQGGQDEAAVALYEQAVAAARKVAREAIVTQMSDRLARHCAL